LLLNYQTTSKMMLLMLLHQLMKRDFKIWLIFKLISNLKKMKLVVQIKLLNQMTKKTILKKTRTMTTMMTMLLRPRTKMMKMQTMKMLMKLMTMTIHNL